jgi:hypothetical protein
VLYVNFKIISVISVIDLVEVSKSFHVINNLCNCKNKMEFTNETWMILFTIKGEWSSVFRKYLRMLFYILYIINFLGMQHMYLLNGSQSCKQCANFLCVQMLTI